MSTYDLIKKSLDATELRSTAIANNIANINTANYKRSYVTFEETLTKEVNKTMKTTNEKHMSNRLKYGDIELKKDMSTSIREDGNNVDLEVEKVNQAATSLEYNALISLTNKKLSNIKSVISGR